MEPNSVRDKLIAIITQLQMASGLECPVLSGETKPIEAVPKFTSKVWPVVTTILAADINEVIPDDVNIFVNPVTKLPRSIDEITVFVCELVDAQHFSKTATA